MPNITISLEDDLLKSGRQYAENHGTSVNALIRRLLEQTVRPSRSDWVEECFALMDRANAHSNGQKWSREELYNG